ncbi:MAG: ABC transporter ATP-binding protein [Candidatus Sericytochromatia bacterium]
MKNIDKKNFARLKAYIRPYYKDFSFCLFLLVLNTAIKVSGPVIIQKSVDDYIVPKDFYSLALILSFYVVILILGFVSNYFEIMKLETLGQTIVAQIKKDAFKHLLTLDMNYFDNSNTGKIVSRIENDTNEMTVLFTSFITTVLGSILLLVSMLGVIYFKYNSLVAFTLMMFIPTILITSFIFNKFMGPILIKLRESVADVSGYVTEIIHGISIVQIFNQEKVILKELEDRSNKKLGFDTKTSMFFNTFFNLMFFLQSIATVIILYIGTSLILSGKMTLGSLILFMNSLSYFFMPIIELSGQFNIFQKGISGGVRIFELLDTEAKIIENTNNKKILNKDNGITIEFKNVYFKYKEKSDWILKNVSFKVNQGEHWAIVGPTGSGKTTIISLLLKFYLPQQGEILINNIDIKDISKDELRDCIGLVLQENILFPGTIYDNLILNKTYSKVGTMNFEGKAETNTKSKQEVIDLMTYLGINDSIMKLENKYDTEIKENGSNISSGEKQLISFGRALLKNPSLLIFDEATSNIDPEIENNIKNAMNNLMKGRTSIVIAHRLSTIRNADKILVLKNGELLELGNHQELIDKKGFYQNLVFSSTK